MAQLSTDEIDFVRAVKKITPTCCVGARPAFDLATVEKIKHHLAILRKDEQHLSPAEARKIAKCSLQIVSDAVRGGSLPSQLTGQGPKGPRRLIRLGDLKAWMAQRTKET